MTGRNAPHNTQGAPPSIWMRYGIIVSSQVGYELVKTHNTYRAFGLMENIVKGVPVSYRWYAYLQVPSDNNK